MTTDTNSQAITLFEPQNALTLSQLAPESYDANSISHARCLEAGNALLARAEKEGMTDALDIDIARFIDKAKVTLRKMNDRRTPVTQLFDRIRRAYTALENDIDPAKADSVTGRLQGIRNGYAAQKRELEQQRLRAEAARQARENAKARYRADVEEDYIRQFTALVNKSLGELAEMDRIVSLDNYDIILESVKNYICDLPDTWPQRVESGAYRPAELTADEAAAIQAGVIAGLVNRFKEQFTFEVQSTRDDILDRLPSKRKELLRISQASAEEAAHIKADMQAKEQAEAARKETERREQQKQAEATAQLAAQKREMDSLFGLVEQPADAAKAYQPKTSVRKKVVINSADDIMRIVAFWWSQEGSAKPLDELCKEFRKQITYANTAANSKTNPMLINDVIYTDEVKAK